MFATNSLLELGGDECYDLNFMTWKIDSFKIRKKIREFAVEWNSLPVDISLDAYATQNVLTMLH